jgi:hypothetical protein
MFLIGEKVKLIRPLRFKKDETEHVYNLGHQFKVNKVITEEGKVAIITEEHMDVSIDVTFFKRVKELTEEEILNWNKNYPSR